MKTVNIENETLVLCRELYKLNGQINELKSRYDEIRKHLAERFYEDGNVEIPLGNGWRMTLVHNMRHSVNNRALKAAAKDNPAIVDGFSVSYSISNTDKLTEEQQYFVTTKDAPPTIKFESK